MEHELKCWPVYFQAVKAGVKTFEIRLADRPYAVGDVLNLREWDPELYAWAMDDGSTKEEAAGFADTGGRWRGRVTYILTGGPWLAPGYVAMAIVEEPTHAT